MNILNLAVFMNLCKRLWKSSSFSANYNLYIIFVYCYFHDIIPAFIFSCYLLCCPLWDWKKIRFELSLCLLIYFIGIISFKMCALLWSSWRCLYSSQQSFFYISRRCAFAWVQGYSSNVLCRKLLLIFIHLKYILFLFLI